MGRDLVLEFICWITHFGNFRILRLKNPNSRVTTGLQVGLLR